MNIEQNGNTILIDNIEILEATSWEDADNLVGRIKLIIEHSDTLQAENEEYRKAFAEYMAKMQDNLKVNDIKYLPRFVWGAGFRDAENATGSMMEPLREYLDRPYPNDRQVDWKTVALAEHIKNIEAENETLRQRVAELEDEVEKVVSVANKAIDELNISKT